MELEYIRSCVSTALADVHYRQRGILEVQLEQMRLGRSGRFNNKPVRSISVGDDNSYEVSVPAEPVRFHQGKTFKQSSMLLTDIDFLSASWRRAIGQLNNEESAWLYYCYGCKPDYNNDVIVCQWLWLDFLVAHSGGGFKKMKASTKKAMRKLIYYAAQQVKSELTCAEAVDEREQDRHLSFLLNISIDSWRQDYKERWLLIKSRCLSLNRTALLNAAEKRSEIIKRHRAGSAILPL